MLQPTPIEVHMESRKPLISDELLEYLEQLYPDRSPDIDCLERVVWVKRGEVGVIRHLKHLHQQQRENILSGDMNNVFRR